MQLYFSYFKTKRDMLFQTDNNTGAILLDHMYGVTMYNSIGEGVKYSKKDYTEALRYCLGRSGLEYACEMYAYCLNDGFDGATQELCEALIYEENYEKCEPLKKYLTIKEKPKLSKINVTWIK